MKREQAVPCLGSVRWVITARPSRGKAAAAILWGRLQALWPREGLKEDFVSLLLSD